MEDNQIKHEKRPQDFRFLNELIASAGVVTSDSSQKDGTAQTPDIRACTQQIKAQLSKLEEECTHDFMALNSQALRLYQDITQSDAILAKVGNVVDGFQGDLVHISDEVRTLQQRSENYHMQLNNRRNLNKLLTNYLDSTLLQNEFIESLCIDDIDKDTEAYLEKVEKLNEMVVYVQNPPSAVGTHSKSLLQIRDEVEKLKHKVCNRAYKFIIAKMNNLRKPNTNFQIYQESILLKYKALISFLKIHNRDVFQDICEKYCEIMNSLYSQKLHQYFKDTWKLVYYRINKNDILFANESEDPANGGVNTKIFEQCMSQLSYVQPPNRLQQNQIAPDASSQPQRAGASTESHNSLPGGASSSLTQQQQRQAYMYDVSDRLQIFNLDSKTNQNYDYTEEESKDMSASFIIHDDNSSNGKIEKIDHQPMFQQNPIVAHISKTKQQKYMIEEVFRSQMKLISDTVAKEFLFILEFFDFKISNTTQQTYMFQKIFKQIISKYYLDKLKENVDWQLFDVYSCLIMIEINEECKKQMQLNFRLGVLDSVLDKISIYILYPRFSKIFNLHLENIKRCEPKIYKLYNQGSLHGPTTVRCYQFLSGLYRLQELISLGDQNNMLRQRYIRILDEVQKFMVRMSKEHFIAPKDQTIYMVNNLDFMVQQLNTLNLKKSKNDLQIFQKNLDQSMEDLIQIYLNLHFEDLFRLTGQFVRSDDADEENEDSKADLFSKERLQNLQVPELEKIGKEFLKGYKAKTESMIKDIKTSINTPISSRETNDNKQKKSSSSQSTATKKELSQKLVRILMLHFTTFVEVIKVGQFGGQSEFLKKLITNTTQSNQVLLDLRNCANAFSH